MFPSEVTFPDVGSIGINRRTVSKVKNRIADFDALEAQNTPLPVYKARIPFCRIVVESNFTRDCFSPILAFESC